MYVILPLHLEVFVPMAILVWLFFFIPHFKRKKTPKSLPVYMLLLCTIILSAVQLVVPNNAAAYEQGEVLLRNETWIFTLEPNETVRIGQISNYYVVRSAWIYFEANQNVSFFLIDENSPEERYNEEKLTPSGFWAVVQLPYLYTDKNVIANWSFCFENQSQSRYVSLLLQLILTEDNLILERWSVRYWPFMPFRILISLWILFPLGAISTAKPVASYDKFTNQALRFMGYSGVWIAVFGGRFLWSLAGFPTSIVGLGILGIPILWVILSEICLDATSTKNENSDSVLI